MEPLEAPQLEKAGNDFIFTWKTSAIQVTVRDIYSGRDGPKAEVEVRAEGHLHGAMLNLLSTSSRQTFVKEVVSRDPSIPWKDMVEQFTIMAVNAWRAGEPLALLKPKLRSALDASAVDPLIPMNVPTLLFGDGGAGKSYLAAAIARGLVLGAEVLGMPCRKMNVAYLDWEWDEEEHSDRLHRLGADGQYFYRPCRIPLAAEQRTLARVLDKNAIDFIVVDSLGYACSADITQADVILEFFGALRFLGRTALVIHHVPKDKKDPYGSAYVRNSVRSAWYMARSSAADPTGFSAALRHNKTNRGRLLPAIGVAFAFEGDGVRLSRTDAKAIRVLGVGPKQRILETLKDSSSGGFRLKELAFLIEETEDLTSVHLSQLKSQGKVRNIDGEWVLASDRSDDPT